MYMYTHLYGALLELAASLRFFMVFYMPQMCTYENSKFTQLQRMFYKAHLRPAHSSKTSATSFCAYENAYT